jgi:hypothetical protein
MSMIEVNVGSGVNSRDGDSLRSAFLKINANFADLYSRKLPVPLPSGVFRQYLVSDGTNIHWENVPMIVNDLMQLTDSSGVLNSLLYQPIGETVILLDGSTINFSPERIGSLITVLPDEIDSSSVSFSVTIPSGVAGQRLLVRNTSTITQGTIDTATTSFVLVANITIELIFSSTGWVLV